MSSHPFGRTIMYLKTLKVATKKIDVVSPRGSEKRRRECMEELVSKYGPVKGRVIVEMIASMNKDMVRRTLKAVSHNKIKDDDNNDRLLLLLNLEETEDNIDNNNNGIRINSPVPEDNEFPPKTL